MAELFHPYIDPAQDFIEVPFNPIELFFRPKTVAVIGASEASKSVGRTLMDNLLKGGFSGKIFPVNPKRETILGYSAYAEVGKIPEKLDLAVIATPAKTVPGIIRECGQAGIRAAIVISAGFKELGSDGALLEGQVIEEASRWGMRLIGPNCLGVMNPLLGLNATFAASIAKPGHIAFISQSGAMCTAVLDWSFQKNIGFSAFVSIGSMADVDWGDLIEYLGNDPNTKTILLYMETIGNPRSFLSAARRMSFSKPILVIKAGRTEAAAKAAASHTGSLAGSDAIFDAAMKRVGVLRVDCIEDLFSMAELLASQPIPMGNRLALVTNAGGPGVLATDAAILAGAALAPLEKKTIDALSSFLPASWSHGNPVDLLGDADEVRYQKAIALLAEDATIDGILAILTPQDMTDPLKTAESLVPYAKRKEKPLIASWMGGEALKAGREVLEKAGIPTIGYPDTAARLFAEMWKLRSHLQALYQTPKRPAQIETEKSYSQVKALIDGVQKSGRTLLTEQESKQLLQAYGLPVVITKIATSCEMAKRFADEIGYPVVLKLHSETITHKTDVGGVKLGINNAQGVAEAYKEIQESVTLKCGKEHFLGVTVQKMISKEGYELIVGSSVDASFGPVLLFGTGGQLVEVYKDRALALPPLNVNLAARLIQETKIAEALQGVRGRASVDMRQLEAILVAFSRLITFHPQIKECDINPLLASDKEIIALDARVVLYAPKEAIVPLAIRPYPIQYVKSVKMKNGKVVMLRPIRPEDEPLMVQFHKELSESTVRQRFFAFLSLEDRIAHERLVQVCCTDHEKDMAFVAEEGGGIIGVLRLLKNAEFKVTIVDRFHRQGLGRAMLLFLLEVAQKEGLQELVGHVLADNTGLLALCNELGFKAESMAQQPQVICVRKAVL